MTLHEPLESPSKRLKTSQLSAASLSFPRSQNWLDLLPFDVNRQIAGYLPPTCSHASLISLAETSPRLCAVVKAAINDNVLVQHTPLTSRWDAVLEREYINLSDAQNAQQYGSLERLLRFGGWSRALIDYTNVDSIMVTLRNTLLLGSLTLYAIPNYQEEIILFNMAFGMRVRELRIRCRCSNSHQSSDCRVQSAMEGVSAQGACMESMVEKFDLSCQTSCRRGYGKVLSTFSNLREVTLRRFCKLSDDMVERLQHLDAVHLHRVTKKDIFTVLRLSQSVATLSFEPGKSNRLTAADLHRLSPFKKLKSLTASLAPGAGSGLAVLPQTLRSLCLDWGDPNSYRSHGLELDGRNRFCCSYYKLKSVAVAKFVQRCPRLSVLKLGHATMPPYSVVQILKTMGLGLEEFSMTLWHSEFSIEWLGMVVEQLAISNWNLRLFEMYGTESLDCGVCMDGIDEKTHSHAHRLWANFQFLKHRAPRLDTHSLQQAIAHVFYVRLEELPT